MASFVQYVEQHGNPGRDARMNVQRWIRVIAGTFANRAGRWSRRTSASRMTRRRRALPAAAAPPAWPSPCSAPAGADPLPVPAALPAGAARVAGRSADGSPKGPAVAGPESGERMRIREGGCRDDGGMGGGGPDWGRG